MIAVISMKSELINELKHVKGHQQWDETIQKLKEKPTNMYQITEDDGVCYIKNRTDDCWKLILPITLILFTLRSTHEQLGHAGSWKLLKYVSQFFYWRGMKRDVKAYTKGYDTCQRVKL